MALDSLERTAVRAAYRSSEVLRARYGKLSAIDKKGPTDLVTDADFASETEIVATIRTAFPDHAIVAEESGIHDGSAEWRWLVDPLDGTKEFIQRNGQFTVNIALIEDHQPVLGVVRVPVTGWCYFAARGQGAFREEPGQSPQPIHVKPLRTPAPVRVVGSRSHGGPGLQQFVAALGAHELVTIGSSLKLCQVAEGVADVYPRLGPTSEWDTAAAQAIVETAGGQVVSAETGEPLRYNTRASLLNPHFIVYGDASRDWLRYVPRDE